MRSFFLGLLLFLTAGIGFIAGRNSVSREPVAVEKTVSIEARRKPEPDAATLAAPLVVRSNQLNLEQMKSAIQRMATNLTSEAQFDDMIQKLIAWAKTDPDAALNFAQSHFANERQMIVLTRMLSELAKSNPQAAWNWTFEKKPDNFQLVDTVLDEIGRTDSKAAWAYASQFAQKYPDEAHNAYYGALRGMTYAGDYETAARLASDTDLISPANHNGDFPAMIASQWANYDPKKASDWLLSLSDGTSRSEALAQVGNVWVQNDPKAAADFAVNLPAGETRRWVMTTAVGKWADADPVAAAGWINQQEKGPDFDQVIMSIATSSKADPATAVEWANSISVKELQVQTLSRIVQIWMGRDQAAATGFLQNSPTLSPEMRKQIQERIQIGN